jgi:hypothetical protein
MFLNKIKINNLFCILILAAVFVFTVLIIPHGEFAVNDDWFYYNAVREALGGNWHPNILIDPSLIFQTFLGYVISLTFGFSFVALKYLVLILVFLALVTFYLIITEHSNKKIALFSTLLLLACPWFLSLSFSFMTDIPAFSFFIFSLYFILKSIRKQRAYMSWIAIFLIGAAIFIRQSYAIVLIAYLLTSLISFFQSEDRINYFKGFIINFLMPSLLLFIIYVVAKENGLWPETFLGRHQVGAILFNFSLWPKSIFLAFIYFALLGFPLLLIYLGKNKKYSLGLITAISFVILSFCGFIFPGNAGGNIINIYSFGANGINLLLDGEAPLMLDYNFWPLIGFISAYFIYYFLALWCKFLKLPRKVEENNLNIFLFFIATGFIFLFINFIGFDRYLLPALAVSLIAFSWTLKDINPKAINWIILIAMFLFSAIGVRDYYLVADAKWTVASRIIQNEDGAKHIDGGAEWSLWHWYNKQNPEILPFYKPEWPWYITLLIPDNERKVIVSYDSEKLGYKLLSQECPKTVLNKTCIYVWQKE